MSDLDLEDEDYSPSLPPARRDESLRLTQAEAGLRLDQVLARRLPDISRSRIALLLRTGLILLDGKPCEPKRRVAGMERVDVTIPPRDEDLAFAPEAMSLTVVHEDDDVIVIDKPHGLVVHPAAGNWQGTLLNGLLHHDPSLARVPRAGIVHRLDKDTSGLMVVARTETAQTDLVRQLQARTVSREYAALAQGRVQAPVRIDAPVGRHPRVRTRMAVVPESRGGKPAATQVELEAVLPHHSLLACRLETGRTHQIRVHLHSIGHPLEGDATYGARPWPAGSVLARAVTAFGRQALHARRLAFIHPGTRQPVEFRSPLPADFLALLAVLEREDT